MVYPQPRIFPGELQAETPIGFLDTDTSHNLAQMIRPYNNKTERTCKCVDLDVPADH